MWDIVVLVNGVVNQLIIGGHHPRCWRMGTRISCRLWKMSPGYLEIVLLLVALNLQQKNITHQIPGKTIMASVSIHVDGTQDHPRLETPKNKICRFRWQNISRSEFFWMNLRGKSWDFHGIFMGFYIFFHGVTWWGFFTAVQLENPKSSLRKWRRLGGEVAPTQLAMLRTIWWRKVHIILDEEIIVWFWEKLELLIKNLVFDQLE